MHSIAEVIIECFVVCAFGRVVSYTVGIIFEGYYDYRSLFAYRVCTVNSVAVRCTV